MNSTASIHSTVSRVLAEHRHDAAGIAGSLHLEDDLKMAPLELVVVALQIGEAEEIEVMDEELVGIASVGDLVDAFERWAGFRRLQVA